MDCSSDSLYSVFIQLIRFHYYRTHVLFEKIGLYPGQPPLLFTLGKKDGQSQRDLAEKLHIKAATITIMVNRMEKSMLVERRRDPGDQRISRVYLTERGKEMLLEVKEASKVIEAECFSGFTAEEQLLLRRFLTLMRDNLSGGQNVGGQK